MVKNRYVGMPREYMRWCCLICGQKWIVAKGQQIGITLEGYICPRCSGQNSKVRSKKI